MSGDEDEEDTQEKDVWLVIEIVGMMKTMSRQRKRGIQTTGEQEGPAVDMETWDSDSDSTVKSRSFSDVKYVHTCTFFSVCLHFPDIFVYIFLHTRTHISYFEHSPPQYTTRDGSIHTQALLFPSNHVYAELTSSKDTAPFKSPSVARSAPSASSRLVKPISCNWISCDSCSAVAAGGGGRLGFANMASG